MSVSSFKARNYAAAICFMTPSMLGFLVFFLIPFIAGCYYSLVDNPVSGNFVGLSNYINLLHNPVFLKAALNTLTFSGICVPLIIIFSLLLAVLLNRKAHGISLLRTAFIVPLVVPVASIVLVWQIMFDIRGSINGLLQLTGTAGQDWMKTGWARTVVIIVYLWKNCGYNMVIFLAGLQNIPREYYEAAEMDGAGAWTKFTGITVPYLAPAAFFVFIMSIINSFKVFRETYLIAGPYPQDGIYMLQHYMNNIFLSLDYQKLTAAAFLTALLIFLIILLLFTAERKISSSLN